jgi:hypothetical protein
MPVENGLSYERELALLTRMANAVLETIPSRRGLEYWPIRMAWVRDYSFPVATDGLALAWGTCIM